MMIPSAENASPPVRIAYIGTAGVPYLEIADDTSVIINNLYTVIYATVIVQRTFFDEQYLLPSGSLSKSHRFTNIYQLVGTMAESTGTAA